MTITRFGENDFDKWYQLETGEFVNCDELFFSKLWFEWVNKTDSKREDDGKYTIFKFGTPFKVNNNDKHY